MRMEQSANEQVVKRREKPNANHVGRHDKLSEVEGYSNPPAKKRRHFREEKVAVVVKSAPVPVETTASESETVKAAHSISISSARVSDSERARDRRPLERRGEHERRRERSFSIRDRDRDRDMGGPVDKVGFSSFRDRFDGHDNGGGRYRGRRDRSDGRQGYRSGATSTSTASGAYVDKWKHDLFDEANRSPTSKNEEDPVAKVEALLAS